MNCKKCAFCKQKNELLAKNSQYTEVSAERNSALLPKLFWPTVRKKCSSDQEKCLKFDAEGREFAKKIWDH